MEIFFKAARGEKDKAWPRNSMVDMTLVIFGVWHHVPDKLKRRMTAEEFRDLALSFPGTIENPHFDRVAFKVINKRIFATLHEESGTANLKFSGEVEQSVFCSFDKKAVYPVPNKWGLQGWTTFELKDLPRELVLDALDTAYKEVLDSKVRKKK